MSIRADFPLLVHTCSPNRTRVYHEVTLSHAFNLQLPSWQKWLKETKLGLRATYHEEMRQQAVVRNPLWSYELRIDRCESSYGVEVASL